MPLLIVVAALLVPGCGGDDEPAPEPVERKEESADKLPQLKRGWEAFENGDAGIAFGRPPGWSAKSDGSLTEILAPDELVSGSISVDRTDEALILDPESFATQTAKLVPGYEEELKPGKPEPFPSPYDGAIVRAEGIASNSGLRQNVYVIVLERKGAAVVTAKISANAERREASAEVKQALEAISTLRTRPPA